MMKSKLAAFLAAICILAAGMGTAQAATWSYSGYLTAHNDVVGYQLNLFEASNLLAWTDSYQNGQNIDPIVALWKKDTLGYNLIATNDDNPSIKPATQTIFDSGLSLTNLAVGKYLLTLTAFPNFPLTNTLIDGFRLDNDQPAQLQQSNAYYHLNVSATPTPAPAALWLLGSGLVGVVGLRRKFPRA